MEMHSRKSLNEIHGISALPRRRPRWRSLMRLGIARVRAVLKGITKAIEAELAARHAIAELVSMDDHMLRDLGLTRGEIENVIRRPQGNVRADDVPVLSSDAGRHRPALPPISSFDLSPEARPAATCSDCARRDQLEPDGLVNADRHAKARSLV
ncbi:DUF1127 domain-containing protein [Bradyrhizobium sp. UFLA05-109]